jgi:hypothetical protein
MDTKTIRPTWSQWLRLLALGALLGAGWAVLDAYRPRSGAGSLAPLLLARALRGTIGIGLGAMIGGRLTDWRRSPGRPGGLLLGASLGSVAGQVVRADSLVAGIIAAGFAGCVAGVGGAVAAELVFPHDVSKRNA